MAVQAVSKHEPITTLRYWYRPPHEVSTRSVADSPSVTKSNPGQATVYASVSPTMYGTPGNMNVTV